MALGENQVNIVIRARDEFSGTFSRASLGLANFRKAALGVAAVGAAVALAMGSAVQKSNEIETGFSKVNTLLDESADAEELFGEYVKEANIAMGNQGDQLSVLDGLYQTISAGITDTAEAQEFMTFATKAAVGGSAELSDVITAGTKTIAAFGLSVDDTERIMDAFAGTVKAGQTTMGELSAAFPTVAGMAGQAGMSIEETLGTFAGLTKILGSSDETATSLSATIRSFIKPTEDMEKAVALLGFESASAMVKEKGLNESLKMLNDSVEGDTQKLAELFPNVRALKAVFPLLGLAAEDVAESIDIVSDSAGLSQKQFEDMAETTEFKWGEAMSAVGNLQKEFGDSIKETLLPLLDLLVSGIRSVSEWWTNLNPVAKQAIIILGLVTVAVGALAAAIAIITLVSSPWLLIIGAIILAITGIVMLITHWGAVIESFKTGKLLPLVNFLKTVFGPILLIIQLAIKALGMAFSWLWDNKIKPLWDFMKPLYVWLKDKFLGILGSIVDKIKWVVDKGSGIYDAFSAGISAIGGGGKTETVGDAIIRPNGDVIKTHPDDTLLAMKNFDGKELNGENITNIYYNITIDKAIGLDPTDLSEALSNELNNKVSL